MDSTSSHSLARHWTLDPGIEVPVVPWPAAPQRLIRLSAQVYNTLDQYTRLADALRESFAYGSRG